MNPNPYESPVVAELADTPHLHLETTRFPYGLLVLAVLSIVSVFWFWAGDVLIMHTRAGHVASAILFPVAVISFTVRWIKWMM